MAVSPRPRPPAKRVIPKPNAYSQAVVRPWRLAAFYGFSSIYFIPLPRSRRLFPSPKLRTLIHLIHCYVPPQRCPSSLRPPHCFSFCFDLAAAHSTRDCWKEEDPRNGEYFGYPILLSEAAAASAMVARGPAWWSCSQSIERYITYQAD